MFKPIEPTRVVVVTGGRDYMNRAHVESVLAEADPRYVIQGGCPTGADRFALDWATKEPGVQAVTCHAAWGRDGHAAGPVRNIGMMDLAALLGLVLSTGVVVQVIAFPGGRGTQDAVRRAKEQGLKVRVVEAAAEEGDR